MPQPLSLDLRKRIVAFVAEGHSCHEAARRFKTAPSTAINLFRQWKKTGRLAAKPSGGFRHGILPAQRAFILSIVEGRGDITMPELAEVLRKEKGISAAPAMLSRFLIGCGLSLKKNSSGIRTRQARPH